MGEAMGGGELPDLSEQQESKKSPVQESSERATS